LLPADGSVLVRIDFLKSRRRGNSELFFKFIFGHQQLKLPFLLNSI